MSNSTVKKCFDYGSREEQFNNSKARMMRLSLWLILLGLIVATAFTALYFGRQHKILLDNSGAAAAGYLVAAEDFPLAGYQKDQLDNAQADSSMKLYFNPTPPKDGSIVRPKQLSKGDKATIKVSGADVTLKLVPLTDLVNGRVVGAPQEININLGFKKDVAIDLVKLLAQSGEADYLRPYPGSKEDVAARDALFMEQKGQRPGAIDMGGSHEAEQVYQRPGAIDMGDGPATEEQIYKRPGAIDFSDPSDADSTVEATPYSRPGAINLD